MSLAERREKMKQMTDDDDDACADLEAYAPLAAAAAATLSRAANVVGSARFDKVWRMTRRGRPKMSAKWLEKLKEKRSDLAAIALRQPRRGVESADEKTSSSSSSSSSEESSDSEDLYEHAPDAVRDERPAVCDAVLREMAAAREALYEDEDFLEGNLLHGLSGLLYGNVRDLKFQAGQRVRDSYSPCTERTWPPSCPSQHRNCSQHPSAKPQRASLGHRLRRQSGVLPSL